MKNDKSANANGHRYDSLSGLPIAKPKASVPTAKKITTAASVHSLTQRSQTLYRRATQKPITHGAKFVRKVGRNMDIARSKSISHFASISAARPSRPDILKRKSDIGPIKHPLIAKIEKTRSSTAALPTKYTPVNSAKDIKDAAITEALKKSDEKPKKVNRLKRRHKFINMFSIGLVLLGVIGYTAYFNMPNLTVRIASAQAGINATYPEYKPDGYSLDGPISYNDGEVTINYRANTGTKKFSILQSKSTWDSTAVKNMVNKDTKGEYMTTEERGLTIYTYSNNHNAAWVNGGILYSITGDALLSNDQIRRIAISF